MWAQLGMAGLQAMQDQKNKQNNLASNAITEKYSGYTGQHGNFNTQGAGSGWSTMLKGLGSGMMQDNLDAKDLADKQTEWKSDSDFYKQGGVGTPIAASSASPKATGGFAAMAQRAPATVPSGNVSAFSGQSQYEDPTPLMLQGSSPQAKINPWEAISNRPLMPTEMQAPDAPMVDPTSASRQSFWNMLPNNLPIKRGY